MKNKSVISLTLLAFATLILACHPKKHNPEDKQTLTSTSVHKDSAIETYLYRGIFPTIYDSSSIGTVALHMIEGAGTGSFTYSIDYSKNDQSSDQKAYIDSGQFLSENSSAFGTIYILKGQYAAPLKFQPIDNKLNELDADGKISTGRVLTGIDPKDSLLTRAQILAASNKTPATTQRNTFWSAVKKQKISFKDADVKLRAISGGEHAPHAYIVFNLEQSIAELFLPTTTRGLMLKRTGTEGNYIWTDGQYELFPWKGYVLRLKNGANIYGGDVL